MMKGPADSVASPEHIASALERSAPELELVTEENPIEASGEKETLEGVENVPDQTTFPAYEDMSCEEPVPHWRNRSRNAVSAQRATMSSKFGKMLARKRPPPVRDIIAAKTTCAKP